MKSQRPSIVNVGVTAIFGMTHEHAFHLKYKNLVDSQLKRFVSLPLFAKPSTQTRCGSVAFAGTVRSPSVAFGFI